MRGSANPTPNPTPDPDPNPSPNPNPGQEDQQLYDDAVLFWDALLQVRPFTLTLNP